MSLRVGGLLLVASLCVAAGPAPPGESAAHAAEPPASKAEPTRTDGGDDLLPSGVVRLGSTRLSLPNVRNLAFSPDGSMLAAVDMSGQLCLLEPTSGKELRRFQTPKVQVGWSTSYIPAAFSADAKLVALGGADNTIRVWETATGKERHTFAGLPSHMTQLGFHPEGRYLAACHYGGPVRILDLQNNKVIEPQADFTAIRCVALAYSSDGKSLIALAYAKDGQKKIVCRWDAEGKELAGEGFEIDGRHVGALSPDGARCAAPTANGDSVRLFDTSTGEELCRTEAGGETNRSFPLSFSADGKALVAARDEGTVRVWETGQGKLLCQFKPLSTRVDVIALSASGKLVAVAGRADGAIHLFDVAKGKELHTFPGHRNGPLTVAFSHDGKTVFTTSRDSIHSQPVSEWADWSLRQWDPATGKELRVTTGNLGGEVHWTCFSDDGRLLATVTHEATLRLWDTDTGEELRRWKVPTRAQKFNKDTYQAQAIWAPAFAPDGKSLVASAGGKVHRWDVTTGDELPAQNIPGGDYFSNVRPGPDEQTLLVFPDNPGPLYLLDTSSGRVGQAVGKAGHSSAACAISPDGRTIAVADNSAGTKAFGVALWEVASGRDRGKLKGAGYISALAFSPDGKLVAAGGDAGVQLFHAASGREVGRLDAYRGRVDSLAFSPDGKRLAVGGYANTALVCDVAALTAARCRRSPSSRPRSWTPPTTI
jgi:WD40 repeat protein